MKPVNRTQSFLMITFCYVIAAAVGLLVFQFVNLFAIQVRPTLIVYACLLPGFYYLVRGGGLNGWTGVGCLLMVVDGTPLELVVDRQMKVFRAEPTDPHAAAPQRALAPFPCRIRVTQFSFRRSSPHQLPRAL